LFLSIELSENEDNLNRYFVFLFKAMFCTYGNENNDAIIEKDKLIDTFF